MGEVSEKSKYYSTPYGQVYISVDAIQAGIRLSSGFDSALLLYLICLTAEELNPNLIIRPLTVRRANATNIKHWDRVDNVANTEKIIEWIRSRFPNLQIRNTLVYDAEHWYYCNDKEPIVGSRHTYVMGQNVLCEYIISDDRIPNKVDSKYQTIMYSGVTKNPNFELSGFNPEQRRNFCEESDVRLQNSPSVMSVTNSVCDIETFRNADKRITFWLADSEGILDTLLSISRSCEGERDSTRNWTEECMECWWCYERHWALETYKDYDSSGSAPKYLTEEYFKTLHYSVKSDE